MKNKFIIDILVGYIYKESPILFQVNLNKPNFYM